MSIPTKIKLIIEKFLNLLFSSSSSRKIRILQKYQIDLDKNVAPFGQKEWRFNLLNMKMSSLASHSIRKF